MMRRRAAPKRKIIPDSKYESEIIAKFMNQLMVDGKKSIAENIVYGAFEQLEKDSKGEDLVEVFKRILDKVAPVVEVRSRRIGGATYQVPVEVRAKRRTALAMRWLVEAARNRKEKSMPARLAAELKEAKDGKGSAVKKKEDMHRMAEANKAFAHFRF
ncbi:MAG: 30S ribosomal protein S7 [Gammaproteobacteria bacterium]|uniref:Small ribosomal subunit protein uS7 n=1 Tax=SAR86 cluster bacterium TaxID=2030880 RepID=A0A520MTW5_9GAMM|nr:30S ribosomal protein S7 [Gammaproteobacteria bacterium]RZO24659.1 MAG: 30S ribosomal protein S7 [SAR86 cluster bacterium]